MIAFDFPLLDVFWSMLWFFGMVIWFFAVASIILDIFRSRDMSGLSKAVWFVFVLLFPLVGLLSYLFIRGPHMHERAIEAAEAREAAFRHYAQDVSGHTTADELTKLVDLRERGALTDAEFERQKSTLLLQ